MNINPTQASNVKAAFSNAGISVSEWARVNGFSQSLVYQVLEGKRLCKRGQSHQIAVALGLKVGGIASLQALTDFLKKTHTNVNR